MGTHTQTHARALTDAPSQTDSMRTHIAVLYLNGNIYSSLNLYEFEMLHYYASLH